MLALGLNAFRTPRHAQPAWSERDLPPLPPAARNGWTILDANASEYDEIVIPDDLEELLREPNWTKASEAAPAIHAFLAARQMQQGLSLYSRAIGHPRFVDTCSLDPHAPHQTPCDSLMFLRSHKVAELSVIDGALRGETARALATTRDMIRADWDYTASARRLLPTVLGMGMTKRSIALASLLVDRTQAAEQPTDVAEELRKLTLEVSSLEPSRLRLERAAIGEAIQETYSLAQISRGLASAPSWRRNLVFDQADTQTRIDRYYRKVVNYVREQTSSPSEPEPPTTRTAFLWWTDNATGKLFLEATVFSGHWSQLRSGRQAVLAARQQLLNELRTGSGPQ